MELFGFLCIALLIVLAVWVNISAIKIGDEQRKRQDGER